MTVRDLLPHDFIAGHSNTAGISEKISGFCVVLVY